MTDPERAYELIRKDKAFLNILISEYADEIEYPPTDNAVTLFMAGAPGAGKTEFAEALVKLYRGMKDPFYFVHIDPDKIRRKFPGYDGTNSEDYQAATSLAVGRLIDKTHKIGQNVIVDGTLSKYAVAERNIDDCLNRYNRPVAIFFVYQSPELAWYYTKVRKVDEGRCVDRDTFINAYINSIDTANALKKKYGRLVSLYIIEKNELNKMIKSPFKVENIDSNVKKVYNRDELEGIIK